MNVQYTWFPFHRNAGREFTKPERNATRRRRRHTRAQRHETMYVHVCDLRLRPRRGLESTRRGSGRHAPYAETRMQDEESRRLTQTRVRTGEAGFDTSTPSPRRSGGRGGLPAGSESSAGRGVITNPSQAEYLEARTSERRPTRATNNTHCVNNRGLSILLQTKGVLC